MHPLSTAFRSHPSRATALVPPAPGWRRALQALLLMLLVGALLQRLVDVAQRSVAQAQARQAAQALQAEAQWRCRALRPAATRQRCLVLLHEHPPADAAGIQALLDAAAS